MDILYRWNPNQYEPVMNNISMARRNATLADGNTPGPANTPGEELEAALKPMTEAELDAWIAMRSEGDELPELDL